MLVEQEVEVSGCVGLDGVELALVRDGAKASEGQTCDLRVQGQADYGEQKEEECAMGVRPGARRTFFIMVVAAVTSLDAACPQYPCLVLEFRCLVLRIGYQRYYTVPFRESPD